jgi:hypothetical protein
MKIYDEQGLGDALAKMRDGQPRAPSLRRPKRTVRFVVGGVVILAALWFWRSGCSCASIMCSEKTLKEVSSPDGKKVARVFDQDCGATTDYATVVALVVRRRLLPDSSETVFVGAAIADGPRGASGGPEVRVRWSGPRDLIVSHNSATGVIRTKPRAFDVTVTHEKF